MWLVRRRLVHWYRQLKALEASLDKHDATYDPAVHQAEVDRIEAAVRRIRVPHYFSNEFYDLRLHIDLVRQRLGAQLAVRTAVEAAPQAAE